MKSGTAARKGRPGYGIVPCGLLELGLGGVREAALPLRHFLLRFEASWNGGKMLPTPEEIVEILDDNIIGQDAAKQVLADAFYQHYLLERARRLPGASPAIQRVSGHVMLIGPTGSGKSEMVRTLARSADVPFVRADATRYSEVGYVGENTGTMLQKLIAAAGGDLVKASLGIVFLDEVDKIARKTGDGPDVSGVGVQQGLLSLLDGGQHIVSRPDGKTLKMDLTGVLFVCAGAFPGLEDSIAKRLGTSESIGFGPSSGSEGADCLAELMPQDLVEFGFLPEFVGRFANIATLRKPGVADLVSILQNSARSSLRMQQRFFALHGIELEFTEDALSCIAERALELGTGARGLDATLSRAIERERHSVVALSEQGVVGLHVGEDCVRYGERAEARFTEQVEEERELPADRIRRAKTAGIVIQRDPDAKEKPVVRRPTVVEKRRIKEMKRRYLHLEDASKAAELFWKGIEKDFDYRPGILIRILDRLRQEEVGAEELHDAYCQSGSGNLEAVLFYLGFQRRRQGGQGKQDPAWNLASEDQREASIPGDGEGEPAAPCPAPPDLAAPDSVAPGPEQGALPF